MKENFYPPHLLDTHQYVNERLYSPPQTLLLNLKVSSNYPIRFMFSLILF